MTFLEYLTGRQHTTGNSLNYNLHHSQVSGLAIIASLVLNQSPENQDRRLLIQVPVVPTARERLHAARASIRAGAAARRDQLQSRDQQLSEEALHLRRQVDAAGVLVVQQQDPERPITTITRSSAPAPASDRRRGGAPRPEVGGGAHHAQRQDAEQRVRRRVHAAVEPQPGR